MNGGNLIIEFTKRICWRKKKIARSCHISLKKTFRKKKPKQELHETMLYSTTNLRQWYFEPYRAIFYKQILGGKEGFFS